MPQPFTIAARQRHAAEDHGTAPDSSAIERAAQIAVTVATQVAPLARSVLSRGRAGGGVKPDVMEPQADAAPQSALAQATCTLARAVNAVGATLYDYSNGQYGIKPVDPKELRRARKEAEREAKRQARASGRAARNAAPKKRGGATWLLVGLGALAVGGAIAAIILRREQVRASATQALDRGRASLRQAQSQVRSQVRDQLAAARSPSAPVSAAMPDLEPPATTQSTAQATTESA